MSIAFDKNHKVISSGELLITDVYRVEDHIPPFSKKERVQLQKKHNIYRGNGYPFEVYYATKIFNLFIRLMLRDIIFKNILYKHNFYKTIYLNKETERYFIVKSCKRLEGLPTMPIYNVLFRIKYKGNYKYRRLTLYGDILKEFKKSLHNGDLSAGVRENKTSKDYIVELITLFPDVDKLIIKKIIDVGISAMFVAVKNSKVDFIVCDLHHSKDRICAIKNKDSYNSPMDQYSVLLKHLGKHKDNTYYVALSDEDHESLHTKEEVTTLCSFTLLRLKLILKGRHRLKYKHIYQILNTTESSYPYHIQKVNVKTNSLKYLYRRVNERYESVNDTK